MNNIKWNNKKYVATEPYKVYGETIDRETYSQIIGEKIEETLPNLLNVKFKLCHVGGNGNKDGFEKSVLMRDYGTIVNQAIASVHPVAENNYDQTNVIGTITYAFFVDVDEKKIYRSDEDDPIVVNDDVLVNLYGWDKANDEDSYVLCVGCVWKTRFPEEAEAIKALFAANKLYFSMECYYYGAKCSTCGGVFYDESEYCEHLKGRFTSGTIRFLESVLFNGAARVDNPADRNAVGLAAAAKKGDKVEDSGKKEDNLVVNKEGGNMYKTFETEKDYNDFVDKITEQVKAQYNVDNEIEKYKKQIEELSSSKSDLEKQIEEKENEVEKTAGENKAILEELDQLKASFTDKENKLKMVDRVSKIANIFKEKSIVGFEDKIQEWVKSSLESSDEEFDRLVNEKIDIIETVQASQKVDPSLSDASDNIPNPGGDDDDDEKELDLRKKIKAGLLK